MTEVMIVSGFLGAGKTTFINRFLEYGLAGPRCLLLENDFGDTGVDAALMERTEGLVISEINSGCVCCSLAGNLQTYIREALKELEPERIILEPSGVAGLSGILRSLKPFVQEGMIRLEGPVTVLGPPRTRAYLSRFGGVLRDQMENAGVLVLRPGTDPAAYSISGQRVPVFSLDWTRENFEHMLLPLIRGGQGMAEIISEMTVGDIKTAGLAYYTLCPDRTYTAKEAEEILYRLRRAFGLKLLRLKGFLSRTGGGLWHVEYTVSGQEILEFEGSRNAGINIIGRGIQREQIERFFYREMGPMRIRV